MAKTDRRLLVEVRGESGRCYGYLDVQAGVLLVRKGHVVDKVHLSAYLRQAATQEAKRDEKPQG